MKMACVIISSKNEGDMLRKTIDSIQGVKCNIPYEIIVIDDGSNDESCNYLKIISDIKLIRTEGIGIAPARNLGAANAAGDMLVFLDAHCTVEHNWLDCLAHTLAQEGADAVCPSISDMNQGEEFQEKLDVMRTARSAPRYGSAPVCGRTMVAPWASRWIPPQETSVEVAVVCGGCFAVKKLAFESVGGYEPEFKSYGFDEEEISIKLWTAGYVLMATPHTCVFHYYRNTAPYQVFRSDVLYNLLYFAMLHYSDERIARIMEDMDVLFGLKRDAWEQYYQVFTPKNIKDKREAHQKSRLYDDDWFFKRFNLHM